MSFVFSGTGGCLCGAIRYECHGVPYAAALCHCRNCQKAHAAAFAPLLFVPPETVTFVKGRVSRHEMVAESGAKMFRDFCRECGSPLFSGGAAFPRLISVNSSVRTLEEQIQLVGRLGVVVTAVDLRKQRIQRGLLE